ncbi:hypothetical protein ABZ791_10765 [Streptomyces huasconensis]|uniref:Uncharacterized protein n=1 Tax=Streptomyces huasconensis TaxID=1854574 RepID=A0ABV3M743_9ACTN
MSQPKSTRTRLVLHRGWQREVYSLPGTREALRLAVKRIDAYAKGDAPRRSRNARSWNSIRNQIDAVVYMDRDGWYGGIVIEGNPRARHAMLQERGFTSPRGRRVKGRRWLKGALLKARVDE